MIAMSRRRIMVVYCDVNGGLFGFRCSNCDWSQAVLQRKPFMIDANDAERARRNFDGHRCAEKYSRSGSTSGPFRTSTNEWILDPDFAEVGG